MGASTLHIRLKRKIVHVLAVLGLKPTKYVSTKYLRKSVCLFPFRILQKYFRMRMLMPPDIVSCNTIPPYVRGVSADAKLPTLVVARSKNSSALSQKQRMSFSSSGVHYGVPFESIHQLRLVP